VTLSADGADGLSRALASPPDLAIVDVMMPGITGYDIVRRLREQPQTAGVPILILTARGQMIDRQTALQAGANDHVAKPVTPQALLEKVDDLLGAVVKRSAPSTDCQVVSVLSLRGGVGVTTLAVNLALSRLRQQLTSGNVPRVCLIDLSPSSGQATLHLRVRAQQTWASLPAMGRNPSAKTLAALLTRHPSGLQVLAAPFKPTSAGALTASIVEDALVGLESLFDFIVIDTPPLIDVAAATALERSNSIVLVLTPEVGAIQATVAVLQNMDEMRERVALVLNHTSPQRGVPEAVIEKALRRPFSHKVPFDPAQVVALPQGRPLSWAKPSSPLAMATQELLGVLAL
jgi:pilus assembly protein CpaE